MQTSTTFLSSILSLSCEAMICLDLEVLEFSMVEIFLNLFPCYSWGIIQWDIQFGDLEEEGEKEN